MADVESMPGRRSGTGRPPVIAAAVLTDPADEHALLAACERTSDAVWLARTVRCDRYTLRGVPARLVDVLVAPPTGAPGAVRTVQVCRKSGRYDGAERDQIVVRDYQSHQCRDWPRVSLATYEAGGEVHIGLYPAGGPTPLTHGEADCAPVWAGRYRPLRSSLAGYDLGRIVLWHWHRYYRVVPREEAEQVAALFAATPAVAAMTLAEANRAASRWLYDAARRAGWRKLTLRERRRYGVSGQWHHERELAPLAAADGHPTGTGEYTRRSAAG